MKEKYSLSLTKEQWNEICCLIWLEHDFKLSDKIKKELKEKYPEVNWKE